MSSRKALGRGLAAIIPQVAETAAEAGSPHELAVDKITPNPRQPRRQFEQQQLEELAHSIRAHGVLEPVIVRPQGEAYELVVGERRWRAARMAGLMTIPAIVRQLTDREAMEMALVENLQRTDLNAIEEAEAYRRLATEFNLTQEQIAARVGKQRSTIANRLRLLELEEDIREELRRGRITPGHALAILALPDSEERRALAQRCLEESLTVRQAEEEARRLSAKPTARKARRRKPQQPALVELEEEMQQYLGTKVRIVRHGASGQIVIEFYGEEDITRLYELIVKR
jgi:ParB family chromosome partitioning protein